LRQARGDKMSEPSKQFSSMHTHTLFDDGSDDVETMCRAAREKNLRSIGFSAHAPIYKKTGIKTEWHLSEDNLERYISEVKEAKKRWQGKLEVYLGLEVDYIKGLRSAMDSDIISLNLDYIIGSVHYIVPLNGSDLFTVDGPAEETEKGIKEGFNGDAEAFMQSYYDALAEMIAVGGFDITGHADLLKKNFNGGKTWSLENEARRQKEISGAISRAGIVAEVNTGGLNRKKINETYPSCTFLSFLKESHVPVTITADAHHADHVNGNYETALQTIIYAGFKEHVIFFGKNNEKAVWGNIPI
jgi:histidinol-phosphatase (PHP family)